MKRKHIKFVKPNKRQSTQGPSVTLILIDLHSPCDDHQPFLLIHQLYNKLGNKFKTLLNYLKARQELIHELRTHHDIHKNETHNNITNYTNNTNNCGRGLHVAIPVEFALDYEVLKLAWQSKYIVLFPFNSVDANDSSMIVQMMKENPKIFPYINHFYRNHEQVLDLAKHEPTNYFHLPKKVQNEPDVFIHQFHNTFRSDLKCMFRDEEFVRRIIKSYPNTIVHSPYLDNPEILKEAITHGFFTTSKIVPQEWKSDREFMLQAIRKNPFWYGGGVDRKLLTDRDFVEKIARFGVRIHNMDDFDFNFQEKLIQINPQNISHIRGGINSKWLNDKKIVLKYISKAKFFHNLSPTLKRDVDVISEALKFGELDAIEHAPFEIWRNVKSLLINLKGVDICIDPPDFIKNEKEIIDFLIDNGNISNNFKAWGIDITNKKVLLRILKNTRGSFYCIVPEQLHNDRDFIRKLIKIRPDLIREMGVQLQLDSSFILELCKLNPYCYAYSNSSISQNEENNIQATRATGIMYSRFENIDDFNTIVQRQLDDKYGLGMKLPERFKTFHIVPYNENEYYDDEDYATEGDEYY